MENICRHFRKCGSNVTAMTSSTQNFFFPIIVVNTNLRSKLGGPMTFGLGVIRGGGHFYPHRVKSVGRVVRGLKKNKKFFRLQ